MKTMYALLMIVISVASHGQKLTTVDLPAEKDNLIVVREAQIVIVEYGLSKDFRFSYKSAKLDYANMDEVEADLKNYKLEYIEMVDFDNMVFEHHFVRVDVVSKHTPK